MKFALLLLIFPVSSLALAQSPYLSVHVKMDSLAADFTRYKIEMKFCEPVKKTVRGNWFSNDTTAIDYGTIRPLDITCNSYGSTGEPEILSGKPEILFNELRYGNQVFAWEKIIVFRISNRSSRGWWPEMYVVVPVRYKAFVTHVELNDIIFQSGKVIFLENLENIRNGTALSINKSLKNVKAIELDKFSLKELLEKD